LLPDQELQQDWLEKVLVVFVPKGIFYLSYS